MGGEGHTAPSHQCAMRHGNSEAAGYHVVTEAGGLVQARCRCASFERMSAPAPAGPTTLQPTVVHHEL
jgi:hypothetical protein